MPILTGEESPASAGIDTKTIRKPTSDAIKIKKISIHSAVANTDFVSAYAHLINIAKGAHIIPLGGRVAQVPLRDGLRWDLDQEWHDGWNLRLLYIAQASGIYFWTVEYEVVEELKEKKGWGQA